MSVAPPSMMRRQFAGALRKTIQCAHHSGVTVVRAALSVITVVLVSDMLWRMLPQETDC